MVKYAVVNLKDVGKNCWLPERFVEGGRCSRVHLCNYPEKKTCKAVDAELAYLHQKRWQVVKRIHAKITNLIAERIRL